MHGDSGNSLDFEKLFAARLQAARVRPYLASALFALHPVETRQVSTMAVDRHWRCYVSPAFVARMPVEELAGVWVHEVSHLLRDHHGRSDRFAREHQLTGRGERLRMNIAADCEINDDVYGDGLVRPEGAVGPGCLGLPAGELMEDYLLKFAVGRPTGRLPGSTAAAGPTASIGSGRWGPVVRTVSVSRNGTRSGSGWPRASAGAPVRCPGVAALGGEGVPSAAGVAGVARRGCALGRRGGRGGGLHLRPAVAPFGRGAAHCTAEHCTAEPPADAAPGVRGHRHVGVGRRRRTGQCAPGGCRDCARRGRPT
ncbi:hypothetical protein GCM10010331_55110 [Streptomyces xanthochromogenes]|nr:hypothetical protein GCM10010331_55110 [Streptomyces xanthochromogenes]